MIYSKSVYFIFIKTKFLENDEKMKIFTIFLTYPNSTCEFICVICTNISLVETLKLNNILFFLVLSSNYSNLPQHIK